MVNPDLPTPSAAASLEAGARLRSLGYLAAAAPVAEERGLPDPKDQIGTFNQILRAMDLSQQQRWSESNRLLQPIVKQQPQLVIARGLIAENHLNLGQPREAAAELEQVLKLRPQWAEALFNLARAYLMSGQSAESARLFGQVLEVDPDNVMAHFNLGSLLMGRDNQRALEHFRKAREKRKEWAPLERNLGVMLADTERYREAEAYLENAVRLAPEDPIGLNYLGIVLRRLGRLPDAIARFRRALEIQPGYHQARLNLAFALQEAGDPAQAVREFELVCRQAPAVCQPYRSYFQTPG